MKIVIYNLKKHKEKQKKRGGDPFFHKAFFTKIEIKKIENIDLKIRALKRKIEILLGQSL